MVYVLYGACTLLFDEIVIILVWSTISHGPYHCPQWSDPCLDFLKPFVIFSVSKYVRCLISTSTHCNFLSGTECLKMWNIICIHLCVCLCHLSEVLHPSSGGTAPNQGELSQHQHYWFRRLFICSTRPATIVITSPCHSSCICV
jgi:hypothetical protein